MRRSLYISVFLALAVCARAYAANVPRYVFSSAGNYPGAFATYPGGLNLSLIVGFYIPIGSMAASTGYIQAGKRFITAQPAGSLNSYLFSINSSDVAVGGFCYPTDPPSGCGGLFATHGYTYDYNTGAITTIDYPGSMSTAAYGINDNGVVVGGFCPTYSACPIGLALTSNHGFIDDNGGFTQLDFPGATETTAFGVNNSLAVVGTFTNGIVQHAFLYQNGAYSDINYPGANWSIADAVNNQGVVVGHYQAANFEINGFMYYRGQFATVNVPGHSSAIAGINSKNDLVGTFTDSKGQNATFKAIPKQ